MPRQVTRSFPAVFTRGGTSNGLIVTRDTLPKDVDDWQPMLSSAMGSPDPHVRQLNGMGSGVSSTSKVLVISGSERDDADMDYTFIQVGIKDTVIDMAGTCGNMSSVVGPVAFNELGLCGKSDAKGEVTLRMFNTNTNKIVHSTFQITPHRQFEPCGDYSIDGVPGTGSRITLSFLDPSGSKTGKALPTGNPVDTLHLPDGSTIEASLVDVANPGVFVLASDLGIDGGIKPDELAAKTEVMTRLEHIRKAGASLMGMDPNVQSVPKMVVVAKPKKGSEANIECRAISMQQPHKAVPLTIALNVGTAVKMPGTIPATNAVGAEGKTSITVAHASGNLEVGSVMKDGKIESALLHRTARIMMKGEVFYTAEETD